jgi:CDP-6-deoxy-D-xylo-4-hexulose-3-dehydrase
LIALAASTWGAEEKLAAWEVLNSGRVTMGEKVKEFEKPMPKYCGTKYCVAVNSGSSANLLMVAAYTLSYGKGTVIVPAVGWATSYSPFQQYGWKLVFRGHRPGDAELRPVALWAAEKYEDDDPVILAINLLGNPNEYWASRGSATSSRTTAKAWARSTRAEDRLLRPHGFAFDVLLPPHLHDGGGMVTTNDEYLYHMLLSSARMDGRGICRTTTAEGEGRAVHFILPGYNVSPTEMQCAIGLEQLKKLPMA